MALIRRHPSVLWYLALSVLVGLVIGYLANSPILMAARPSLSNLLARVQALEAAQADTDADVAELLLMVAGLEARLDECCGCTDNSDCAAEEYCQRETGDCGGTGVCESRPGDCPDVWDPVCGCDGQTYANACLAAAAGVSVDHAGECDPGGGPCDSNADCAVQDYCARAPGDCGGVGVCEARPAICPDIWDPVCGCDGQTYANACEAAKAGVSVDHDGECAEPTCNDGIQNGDETDVDCGGSCGPCGPGENCQADADCESGVCSGGVCQPAMCTDGVHNGDETDVDCGGSCGQCGAHQNCQIDQDCQSGACVAGVCGEDQDGDGFAPPDDCNDADPDVYPNAPEFCDGVDNDCDGEVDESFPVGQACVVGVGECGREGVLVCTPNGMDTQCSATPGAPTPEICDGLDNDCDGVVDEGCP